MSRLVLFFTITVYLFTNILYAETVKGQDIYEINVQIRVTNSSTFELISKIEEQTEFKFLYTHSLLESLGQKFSYEIDSVSVGDFLYTLSSETGLWFLQLNSSIAVGSPESLKQVESGTLICSGFCAGKMNEQGRLSGRIIDAVSKEPIYGATILLKGSVIGAATNFEGEFSLKKLPVGLQSFQIRSLGYKNQEISVRIVSDQVNEIEIALEPDVFEGDDIVVYSQAEGQVKAIREQVASTSVINVVSEAKLRELPDANAAESVGRLPGVSVIRNSGEGESVAIRGLSPRHNSITLDGDRIPSSDEDGRSVNLNMISPDMLSGIELYKSLRPDMDADAIGGAVNFKFAGVPEKRAFRLNVSGGYSNHITEVSNYSISFNGSDRFFKNTLGILASVDLERNDRSSDSFSAGYEVLRDARDDEEFAPIGVTGLTLGDKYETRDRYGAGMIMDIRLRNGSIMINNFASRLGRDITNRTRSYRLDSFSQGFSINNVESETDILSSRISGEHDFNIALVEWRFSRNSSKKDTPYDHDVSFRELGAFEAALINTTDGPASIPPAAFNELENTGWNGSSFERTDNHEQDYSSQLDITVPLRIGNQISGDLKLGGKGLVKERERNGREWGIRSGDAQFVYLNENRNWIFTSEGELSIYNFLDSDFKSPNFLDGQYDMSVGLDEGAIRELWDLHEENHIERLTIVFDDQKAIEKIYGTYILTELNIGSRVVLLPGVRYEYTDSEYTAKQGQVSGSYRDQGTITDTVATQQFGMFFPMVQARIKVTDWLDVRLARTETISRPNFTELLPREEISANSSHVKRGTPDLNPAESTNYDAFLTVYSNKIGLLSIGGFYKQIDKLIYNRQAVVLDPAALLLPQFTRGYALYEPYNNPNQTEVKGLELEWQSNLTYLPVPFNGLVLNMNYTRIWSETQYPQFYLERTAQGIVGVDTYREGPMVNQPDYVVNGTVGYDLNKFSLRFSLVYQGKTLTSVGARPEIDTFTEEFMRMDAALKYKVKSGFSVFANIQNLNNRPDLSTQFTEQFPTYQEYYNWLVDAGVRYEF